MGETARIEGTSGPEYWRSLDALAEMGAIVRLFKPFHYPLTAQLRETPWSLTYYYCRSGRGL